MVWHRQITLSILQSEPKMAEEIALSNILGAPVYDGTGDLAGHVREVAVSPQDDRARVSDLVVKTPEGDRLLALKTVRALERSAVRATTLIRANGRWEEW